MWFVSELSHEEASGVVVLVPEPQAPRKLVDDFVFLFGVLSRNPSGFNIRGWKCSSKFVGSMGPLGDVGRIGSI